MNQKFEMVAKTFQGLEEVLAEELRALGADNVEVGRRMVSFEGDLEMLYKANMCCRTALRILKPIYKFIASDTDSLYEMIKEYDWEQVLTLDKTFAIDSIVNSEEFTHSRFVTYRVKDAIVDWFKDKYNKRPGVRLQDADVIINVHISGDRVTLSLDSSGESLHKRGYRVAQTEAPINEVLAAGIILKSGWRGETPFVDPMCGSGTFLIEAALIAANINPGVYRSHFAFESWADYDQDLYEKIYNDDSAERVPENMIYGADMSAKAIEIARKNIKSAGVAKYIDLQVKALSQWDTAPAGGTLITNPPYGERIGSDDMDGLYSLIGTKLKNVFKGYKAWIISYKKEYFDAIGLAPSSKTPILNGALECELREYVIFDGDMKSFKAAGGKLHDEESEEEVKDEKSSRRLTDKEWKIKARKGGFGGKDARGKESRGKDGKKGGFRKDFRSGERDFNSKDSREKSFRAKREFDERRGGFKGGEHSIDSHEEKPEQDNPLAIRRNEHALKSISQKKPSLPPAEGPFIRTRRRKKNGNEE